MKIAIMQPYFAPYIGYFQLINAVDKFVFMDDAKFIKGGWINRNFISLNGSPFRFSIPLKKLSSNKQIKEVEIAWDTREMEKLGKTFRQRFARGSISRTIIDEIMCSRHRTISSLAIASIQNIATYLGIDTKFATTSKYEVPAGFDRTEFLVHVCRTDKAKTYINSAGGKQLYCKHEFAKAGVALQFLEGKHSASLLDIIDHAPRQKIIDDLKDYRLS